jgi:hypothetical protein
MNLIVSLTIVAVFLGALSPSLRADESRNEFISTVGPGGLCGKLVVETDAPGTWTGELQYGFLIIEENKCPKYAHYVQADRGFEGATGKSLSWAAQAIRKQELNRNSKFDSSPSSNKLSKKEATCFLRKRPIEVVDTIGNSSVSNGVYREEISLFFKGCDSRPVVVTVVLRNGLNVERYEFQKSLYFPKELR